MTRYSLPFQTVIDSFPFTSFLRAFQNCITDDCSHPARCRLHVGHLTNESGISSWSRPRFGVDPSLIVVGVSRFVVSRRSDLLGCTTFHTCCPHSCEVHWDWTGQLNGMSKRRGTYRRWSLNLMIGPYSAMPRAVGSAWQLEKLGSGLQHKIRLRGKGGHTSAACLMSLAASTSALAAMTFDSPIRFWVAADESDCCSSTEKLISLSKIDSIATPHFSAVASI